MFINNIYRLNTGGMQWTLEQYIYFEFANRDRSFIPA
jgi:hypothetical protein